MKGIDYSQLRSLTARKIITGLLKDGFYLESQSGSHHQFYHPDKRMVTVSFHHSGDIFKIKTLKSIIEVQAQWTQDDLKRLKLLK